MMKYKKEKSGYKQSSLLVFGMMCGIVSFQANAVCNLEMIWPSSKSIPPYGFEGNPTHLYAQLSNSSERFGKPDVTWYGGISGAAKVKVTPAEYAPFIAYLYQRGTLYTQVSIWFTYAHMPRFTLGGSLSSSGGEKLVPDVSGDTLTFNQWVNGARSQVMPTTQGYVTYYTAGNEYYSALVTNQQGYIWPTAVDDASLCKVGQSAGNPVSITLQEIQPFTVNFEIEEKGKTVFKPSFSPTGGSQSVIMLREIPFLTIEPVTSTLAFGNVSTGSEHTLPLVFNIDTNVFNDGKVVPGAVKITYSFKNTQSTATLSVKELNSELTEDIPLATKMSKSEPLKITRHIIIKSDTTGDYKGNLTITASLP